MGDTLTAKEREFAERLRLDVRLYESLSGRKFGESAQALAIIDRLCSEVERLRAAVEFEVDLEHEGLCESLFGNGGVCNCVVARLKAALGEK